MRRKSSSSHRTESQQSHKTREPDKVQLGTSLRASSTLQKWHLAVKTVRTQGRMALFARCLIYFAAIYVTEPSPIGDTRVVKPALYGTHSCTHTYCTLAGRHVGSNVWHIKAVYLMSPSSIFFTVRKTGCGCSLKRKELPNPTTWTWLIASRLQGGRRSSITRAHRANGRHARCHRVARNGMIPKTRQNPRLTLKVTQAAGAEG